MSAGSVLDASALLAYLQDEPGADRVTQALIVGCAISAANWAEVLSKLIDAGQDPESVTARMVEQGLLHTALEVRNLDESAAREVARLRPLTKGAGLSLGDRACLALGCFLGLPVLTTDRVWKEIENLDVVVEVIR